MAKPVAKQSNNANNDDNSWLLPIELRISSVQKETASLQESNKELFKRLLLLRRCSVTRARNRTKTPEATITPLAQV